MKLSAVLVSFNTKALTMQAISDLIANLDSVASSEIIVVDNHSNDGTVEAIQNTFPTVQVIQNRENVGFGKANNQAFEVCNGEYVLLLNTDAFVHDRCVDRLVSFLDKHPEVGVVAPRVLNADGSLQPSVYPFPSPVRCWIENLWLSRLVQTDFELRDWRSWSYDISQQVPWVIGACMLVRKSVIDSTGGFDEQFFMYSEETDWQLQIRKAGCEVWFLHSAEVTHLGGASGDVKSLASSTRRAFFDSLDYFIEKNHGLNGLLMFKAGMAVGSLLRLILWAFVAIVHVSKRELAVGKMRHYVWLMVRLLTGLGLQGRANHS